jgi:4-hydroxy-3-methylbut-2-enyl diphosphate reductase
MQIIRAQSLGMCFGVRDAIALAVREAGVRPLTILGDLVHNDTVLEALRGKGIAIAQDLAGVRTGAVMITAHGASERDLARARALGHDLVEATCPLVHVAHKAVRALVRDGYHPVIVGRRDHVEVRGLVGDLDAFDVVLDEADVDRLPEHPRLGVAAQTTQPVDRVRRIVSRIARRFPASHVRFIDTVCRPTKDRQAAARDLARQSDVVVVVGGAASNNTRELVATCLQACARVHHVQDETALRSEWFLDAAVVGLTAGTSTPDEVVDRVERGIREMAAAGAPSPVQAAAGSAR